MKQVNFTIETNDQDFKLADLMKDMQTFLDSKNFRITSADIRRKKGVGEVEEEQPY